MLTSLDLDLFATKLNLKIISHNISYNVFPFANIDFKLIL